jgi:chromosomal replication initiator protein
VEPEELLGVSRLGMLIPARFALYMALHQRGWSYAAIGRFVGGRDHTTVIHGVARAQYKMERDWRYKAKVNVLINLTNTDVYKEELKDDGRDQDQADGTTHP